VKCFDLLDRLLVLLLYASGYGTHGPAQRYGPRCFRYAGSDKRRPDIMKGFDGLGFAWPEWVVGHVMAHRCSGIHEVKKIAIQYKDFYVRRPA
jgi:hypothetical protein